MNRKYAMAIVMVLLFAGIAVSQLPTLNTTITVTKEQKTALTGLNLTTLSTGPTFCETPRNICTTKIYKQGAIDAEIRFDYNSTHSTAEIQAERDAKIKARLELVADAEIERQKESKVEKLGPGTITIN